MSMISKVTEALLVGGLSLLSYVGARYFADDAAEHRSLKSLALGVACLATARGLRLASDTFLIEICFKLTAAVSFLFATGLFFRPGAEAPVIEKMNNEGDRSTALVWFLSLASGFAVGISLIGFNVVGSNDQVQNYFPFYLVWYFSAFCMSALFGMLNPTRVWRWAVGDSVGFMLSLSLSQVIIDYLRNSAPRLSMGTLLFLSFGVVIGAFGGAISGLLTRKSIDAISKEGWRSFWP